VTEHLEIYLDNIDKFHRQCMIVDFYYRSNSNDFPMIRFMVFNGVLIFVSTYAWICRQCPQPSMTHNISIGSLIHVVHICQGSNISLTSWKGALKHTLASDNSVSFMISILRLYGTPWRCLFKACLMFSIEDHPYCPVKSFEMYISKLHPLCISLWQRPKESFSDDDATLD
jgi:hypothetical protein